MKFSILILALLFIQNASAESIPDLGDQKSWGPSEKKSFIQYLESGKQMPISGSVKNVSNQAEISHEHRKARFATFNLVANSLYLKGNDNLTHVVSSNLGAKLLFGGHLFSWVRYFTGLKYSALDQNMKNGQRARLNHYEFPIGMELALIPLGTPQTRYVILRAGMTAHYIQGSQRNSDFDNSLLGLRGSWDLGLGYEWQIPDTRWRFHTLLEGKRSMSKERGNEFIGIGLTTGMVLTF
jgi:hypothetical protein